MVEIAFVYQSVFNLSRNHFRLRPLSSSNLSNTLSIEWAQAAHLARETTISDCCFSLLVDLLMGVVVLCLPLPLPCPDLTTFIAAF
jgi:hypothetical protein